MNEPRVRVEGRVWYPFSIAYDADDREYSFTIHALSHEHAALVLDDIKATARVDGRIVGWGDVRDQEEAP